MDHRFVTHRMYCIWFWGVIKQFGTGYDSIVEVVTGASWSCAGSHRVVHHLCTPALAIGKSRAQCLCVVWPYNGSLCAHAS